MFQFFIFSSLSILYPKHQNISPDIFLGATYRNFCVSVPLTGIVIHSNILSFMCFENRLPVMFSLQLGLPDLSILPSENQNTIDIGFHDKLAKAIQISFFSHGLILSFKSLVIVLSLQNTDCIFSRSFVFSECRS
jgi:hypothetical protein